MNIYIHVPFCVKKCNYCAFYSIIAPFLGGGSAHSAVGGAHIDQASPRPASQGTPLQGRGELWHSYKTRILFEIDYWCERLGRAHVFTVFFGGGTPSLMPTPIFAEIMAALREKFDMAPDAEITIEANPRTIDTARLQEFIAAGVNRISIGVQSLNDDELKFLGRIHDAAAARELIATAQKTGIRVSADFIYGLPGQSVEDVKNLCGQINDLKLEHASLYELSIEMDTVFARMNLRMPDNETMAQMYETIGETLHLPRYEVSNYGTPCKHNANVWDGQQYLGLGPSAAGRVLINGQWWETRSTPPFAEGSAALLCAPVGGMEEKNDDTPHQGLLTRCARKPTLSSPAGGEVLLPHSDRAIEILMTGLRTTRGVELTPEIREIIDWDFAQLAMSNEQLAIKDDRLIAKSFLTLDNLIVRLLKD